MPGAPGEWHKLDDVAIATNQQVCGHLDTADFPEVRMAVPIQAVLEQLFYLRPAEPPWGKTDAVQHNKLWLDSRGALVLIRARALLDRLEKSIARVDA